MSQLNENLFKDLSRTLRMTYKEISSQTNIAMTTLYRIIETPSKISVQQLIDLANGLRVPVSHFISKDNNDALGEREDYIKFDGYKDCYYDKGAIQKLINTGVVSSYRDAAPIVGLHPNRVKESLLAEHRLPVTRLLNFCDTIKIDYSYFIVDPNPQNVNTREQKNIMVTAYEYATIQHDFSAIQHEMAIFRAEIINVRREIARFGKKIDELIDTYYEEIPAPKEAKRAAALSKKKEKEKKEQDEQQNTSDKILLLPSL